MKWRKIWRCQSCGAELPNGERLDCDVCSDGLFKAIWEHDTKRAAHRELFRAAFFSLPREPDPEWERIKRMLWWFAAYRAKQPASLPKVRSYLDLRFRQVLRDNMLREDAIMMGRAPDLLEHDLDARIDQIAPPSVVMFDPRYDCLCPVVAGPHSPSVCKLTKIITGADRVGPSIWKER